MPAPSSNPSPLSGLWRSPWLLLVLPPLFWAGNFVIARATSQSFPPVAFAFWRWAVAFLILMPFAGRTLWRARRQVLARWKFFLALGVFGIAGYNTFVYLALQTTTAVNAAVMNSVIPVVIPLFAWAIARERVTAPQIAGIAVSVCGALWIVARGDLATLADFAFRPGDLWMLLAVVDWAIYSVLLRYRPADLDPLAFLAASVLFGVAVMAPFWLWGVAKGATMPMTGTAAASVLYVGLAASVLAYVCWNRSVALVGATVTGLSVHLQPVLATALAVFFLGEAVHGFHLVGAGLIVTGIYLAMAVGRRRAAA